MKEPYFMQQIHKMREKESRILWTRFKGDFLKFHQWRMKDLEKDLRKVGFELKEDRKGNLRLVEMS